MMELIGDVVKINGNSNSYLFLKPEIFLIDCSSRVDSEHIKNEIEKFVSLKEVKKILLTHLHYDHCGNLDLFPDAEVYVSKEELDDFREGPEDFFSYELSDTSKQKILKANELPNEINGLNVIKVPGHTRGSVVFLDEKNKLLFSGDTLFEEGIGRTDFKNSVPEKVNESVKLLKDLVLKNDLKLFPGHDY